MLSRGLDAARGFRGQSVSQESHQVGGWVCANKGNERVGRPGRTVRKESLGDVSFIFSCAVIRVSCVSLSSGHVGRACGVSAWIFVRFLEGRQKDKG